MTAKKQSIESMLAELEAIVATLEKTDTPLEQSISMFESGLKLASSIKSELATMTNRIEQIKADLSTPKVS